jgi:hypothetical protein
MFWNDAQAREGSAPWEVPALDLLGGQPELNVRSAYTEDSNYAGRISFCAWLATVSAG